MRVAAATPIKNVERKFVEEPSWNCGGQFHPTAVTFAGGLCRTQMKKKQ